MRLRRWVAAFSCAVSAFTLAAPLSVAQAAGGVSIVDLPIGVRYEPRAAQVIGVGATGFLYVEEAYGFTYGPTVAHWRTFSGDDSAIAGADENTLVLGDRLLSGDLQRTRLISDTDWQTVAIPSGYGYETATGDGLILTSGAWNDESVSLLPWSGGAPTMVTGFPSGRIIDAWALMGTKPVDARGVLLRARSEDSSNGSAYIYIDTATGEAQTVPSPPDSTDAIGLSPTGIAWRTVSGGVSPLQSVDRPAAHHVFGAVSSRPAPAAIGNFQDLRLLAVGTDVLALQGLPTIFFQRDYPYPVLAVAPDGTTRTLAAWGHGVHAYSPGVALLVAGPDPTTEAIETLTVATGVAQTVVALPSVAAKFDGITFDEGRVVYATDTDSVNAVMQQALTDNQGTLSLGPAEELGNHADAGLCSEWPLPSGGNDYGAAFGCTSVFAGGGSTAFSNDFAGTVTDTVVRPGVAPWTTTQQLIQGVDGPWLHGGYPEWQNIDTGASRNVIGGSNRSEQDGVVYTDLPQGRIGDLDLATGTAGTFDVPDADCGTVGVPQVAGSWVYTTCTNSSNNTRYVVWDRVGANPVWNPPPDRYLLGNGFLLRATPDGALQWTDLSDSTHPWQTLAAPLGVADSIAASHSPTLATVAWTDGSTAHVAELPVATTPMPPHPSDMAAQPPHQPSGSAATVADSQVTLTWNAANPVDAVDNYQLNVKHVGENVGQTVHLARTATSTVVNFLTDGQPYVFSLTAVNRFGSSPVASVTATPGSPAPPTPVITNASVDQVSSRLTVDWTEASTSTQESPTFYVVAAGPYQTSVSNPSLRSAQLVIPVAGTWPVTVTAKTADGSAASNVVQVTAPGLDTVPPSIPKVSLPIEVMHARDPANLFFSATDDRGIVRYIIRTRTTTFGQAFGAWSIRAAWNGTISTNILTDTRSQGSTHCYSVRAVDSAGNASGWSPALCQVIRLGYVALTQATSGWARSYNSRYDSGSALVATRLGAKLTHKNARGDRFWVVALKCPTCGTVGVYSGSTLVKKISLYAATTKYQQLIRVDWTHHWAATM